MPSAKSRLPLPEMAERAAGDSFSNEVKTGKSGDSYFLRLGVGFMDKLNLKGDGYVLDVVMGEKDGKPTMTLIPSSKPREQRAPKGSKKVA